MPEFTDDQLLAKFLRGEIDNASFRHRDHVQVAFAILKTLPFADAAHAYSRALRGIAARAGRPEAYHETITFGFLALISEAMNNGDFRTSESLVDVYPQLLDKSVLLRWYPKERLSSEIARRTFILPQPIGLP